ncbi:MAG: BamA/TamA family outer membrane protein [Proteobacteria bacterium]|nr:BamA/TamA family outer membrane protein [Pseudomonadota bacterium]
MASTASHAQTIPPPRPPPVRPSEQAGPGTPAVIPSAPASAKLPAIEPIIPDTEFDAAIPKIAPADDPELNRPLESIEAFERNIAAAKEAAAPEAAQTGGQSRAPDLPGTAPIIDAELAKPLPPLDSFNVTPTEFVDAEVDNRTVEVGYAMQVNGLSEADALSGGGIASHFNDLSALRQGKGHAANLAQLSSRVSEDAALLKKLLAAEGWFDAQVATRIDRTAGQPLAVVLDAAPGKRFAYSGITVAAEPTVPAGLIRDTLALKVGQPVVTATVLAAEARTALTLPENGYPFARIGARDILLDRDTGGADYTLPVTIGPRGRYGELVSQGKQAFGADHLAVLARFKPGQIYDSRQVDDLRQALIATGLFRTIAVEPQQTGAADPDGTEKVTLMVTQDAGPPRVLAATAGYGTGEGPRVQGSWTHSNLFPPEGALIITGVAGTLEQGASVAMRRSNAGRRDRTFELMAQLLHSDYDAYSAYTGRLSARVSYDSTPLWQKRLSYAYGVQLLGTDESVYDAAQAQRVRRTYAIAGLTGQVGMDTTDSLLDPTRGFRLTVLAEPEGSVRGKFSPYARLRIDGSTYLNVGGDFVLAARARLGTIQGAALNDLAPSRRFYAGGGGSVRGFAYQQLGPRDPNNDPTGGRSLNEASLEARYRFGDYGLVAFADIGQSYQGTMPRFTDLRAGVGLGVRIYTSFGPMRVDLATPLARKADESRINVYVSIGQAF